MKPFTSWLNVAEGEIKKLKKGFDKKLIKSGDPKILWDDCLEVETYIRSNILHSIYKLGGEVPETIMSGTASDINQFCEFEWFKWVMFWNETALHPNDHFRLGRYMGPCIDIGPASTAKVIKENGVRSFIGSRTEHWPKMVGTRTVQCRI